MIKPTNYKLFYSDFASLMEKHYNKMDRCPYLNAEGEVTYITLQQQTPLFANFFWEKMLKSDPEKYEQIWKYLDKDQDIAFYNLNYRDRLKRVAERFIKDNIAEPIYI